MSTQSYVADKQKVVNDLLKSIHDVEREISKNTAEMRKVQDRIKKAGGFEFGKKQYLGNEIEALQAKNTKAASKRKALLEDKKKADALLAEAKVIAKDPAAFKRKYQSLVRDSDQRVGLHNKEIAKNNAKIQEFQRDYDRAGALDLAAKGFIRDRQKALQSKNASHKKAIDEQKKRRQGFEAKLALVEKITATGFAGWGVAALGGLFVAANL